MSDQKHTGTLFSLTLKVGEKSGLIFKSEFIPVRFGIFSVLGRCRLLENHNPTKAHIYLK